MRSDAAPAAGGAVAGVEVRRSARARRMRLAVDPRDGAVRLILPARAALAPALAWAEAQRGWIEAQRAALPTRVPLVDGAQVPLEGVTRRLVWREALGRRVALEGDLLLIGGPREQIPARLLRWFRARACVRLDDHTRACAARAGVSVGRVAVGDPRSRWGSCSGNGDIRYSWRLILAPPDVLEATVAHEVAHRLHMNHGPDFHRAVAALLGREPAAERAWLRRHGASLQAFGRG